MYINTKHLQILKTIKNNQVSNLRDISDIFSLSNQHAKLYLEDIYYELFQNLSRDLKPDLIINKIKKFSNAKNILKKSQQFTKNQKIFYLIFRLVNDKKIKLSHICEDLNLTKRNLNNYLKSISNVFSLYNLNIKISNKGVAIIGSPYSIKRFKFFLIFKSLVEKDFLPEKIRNEIVHFIKVDNLYRVKKDIAKFFKIIDCDFIKNSEIALFSFYAAFADPYKKQKTIEDISYENFLRYKPYYYNHEFFKKIFNILKNTCFKNIPTIYLNDFFTLIDFLNPFEEYVDNFIKNKNEDLRDIFAKYLGSHIYTNPNFFRMINPWINYSYLKSHFCIDDPAFLNINLIYFANSNIYEMTKEINQILPGFTLFETIFLWYYFSESEHNETNNIFVFKNLPSTIIPSLINEIYKKHNIKINNYVNIREFNEYQKYNHIDSIVMVENFKIYNNNIPVKNLFFPIPNFKKVVSM
ncbi:MAG: hypothetical protein ACRCX8_06180 [Sarcina sp.]